jgi:DNA-directed RNA polymerase specialized sigma24 family protein
MAPEDVPDITCLPSTELREAFGDMYGILSTMAPDERIALVLHRVQGLSLEDAANAAGASLATFRRRLARGEAKFFARAKTRPTLEAWVVQGDKP